MGYYWKGSTLVVVWPNSLDPVLDTGMYPVSNIHYMLVLGGRGKIGQDRRFQLVRYQFVVGCAKRILCLAGCSSWGVEWFSMGVAEGGLWGRGFQALGIMERLASDLERLIICWNMGCLSSRMLEDSWVVAIAVQRLQMQQDVAVVCKLFGVPAFFLPPYPMQPQSLLMLFLVYILGSTFNLDPWCCSHSTTQHDLLQRYLTKSERLKREVGRALCSSQPIDLLSERRRQRRPTSSRWRLAPDKRTHWTLAHSHSGTVLCA